MYILVPYRPSVHVYETFKLFATELMLALFLDLDVTDSADLVHDVASLATTHWHGKVASGDSKYHFTR